MESHNQLKTNPIFSNKTLARRARGRTPKSAPALNSLRAFGAAAGENHRQVHKHTTTKMINNFEDLYLDQLRDIYSAETQLIQALPEMISAASDEDLRAAFENHLEETRQQKQRLDQICSDHGISPAGETCEAMQGLIKEARKHVAEVQEPTLRDALLIASANRVEHYEIAAYGVARSFAESLGLSDEADMLGTSLDEESAADERLTQLATGGLFNSGINAQAAR
jgi:ferritin-like metal-binding protein YciE